MQKLLKFDNFCILHEENASIIVDRNTGIISTADSTVELMMGRLFDELCANILKSQELLATHPVNLKRVAEGKDPANSIWPWSPGYRPQSVMAKGRLTGRQTSRAGRKLEHSDPVFPYGRVPFFPSPPSDIVLPMMHHSKSYKYTDYPLHALSPTIPAVL